MRVLAACSVILLACGSPPPPEPPKPAFPMRCESVSDPAPAADAIGYAMLDANAPAAFVRLLLARDHAKK